MIVSPHACESDHAIMVRKLVGCKFTAKVSRCNDTCSSGSTVVQVVLYIVPRYMYYREDHDTIVQMVPVANR